MVGHGDKHHQYGKQQRPHHEIIDVLPFIFVCQPSGQRSAQLSENHKKQVNSRHADAFLSVQLVPSFCIHRVISRRDVAGGLHPERILDQRKQVDHHQHHPQKSHYHTTDSQHINAVGLGAYVAQQVKQRKTYDAHHLFPTEAHQLVEEG